MRILVTGSSGYIGRRLVERLKGQGHEVLGIDRVAAADSPLDSFVQCDLLEPDRYAHVLERLDLLCHLAAAKGDWGITRDEYYRDNLDATRSLLAVARDRGARRWIFYSTVSALGPSEAPLAEAHPRRPVNPYGASKAACEELFESYAATTPGAHVVVIRPSVVFGPGNPWNTNIQRLIESIHKGRFVMIGRGEHVKTTSYIDNLLDAHLFLQERLDGRTGVDVFHYVDEPAESTATLVRNIRQCLGLKPSGFRLPLGLASTVAVVADAAAAVSGVDLPITSARIRKFCTSTNFSAKAIRDLGFVQRTDNYEALRGTVEWYLSGKAGKGSAA